MSESKIISVAPPSLKIRMVNGLDKAVTAAKRYFIAMIVASLTGFGIAYEGAQLNSEKMMAFGFVLAIPLLIFSVGLTVLFLSASTLGIYALIVGESAAPQSQNGPSEP